MVTYMPVWQEASTVMYNIYPKIFCICLCHLNKNDLLTSWCKYLLQSLIKANISSGYAKFWLVHRRVAIGHVYEQIATSRVIIGQEIANHSVFLSLTS